MKPIGPLALFVATVTTLGAVGPAAADSAGSGPPAPRATCTTSPR